MMKDGLSEDISKDGENEAQKLHDKYGKKLGKWSLPRKPNHDGLNFPF